MIYDNILDLIGNTPLLKITDLVNEDIADVYVKLEKFNPGGSIKDRTALGMIEDAEKRGLIKPGDTIVEPTSGNTGIGLSMVGTLKGYNVIIVMPDNMSIERIRLMKAYGSKLVLTPGKYGMKGAIEKAYEIKKDKEGFFIPSQFSNEANPKKHYETTAEEIIKDIPNIDAFVASVGTAGTLIGTGEKLKEYNAKIMVVAVEPLKSPLLSGGKANSHNIQGIGANFIPDIYNGKLVDKVITVSDEDAFKYARIMAIKKSILVGISSGANIFAAIDLAKKLGKGKTVVTVAPDGGEKYLSTGLYD